MKFNPECLRDLLLAVESESTLSDPLYYFDTNHPGNQYPNTDTLKDYDWDTMLYHIYQAESAGLLEKGKGYIAKSYEIGQLTPEGHEFLADIEPESKWKKVKTIISKYAPSTIPALIEIINSNIPR